MHPSQRRARALVLILASALALPLAGRGSAGPAPAPAGALSAVPTAGSLYKVVLKDGQEAQLRLVDYDRYFLTVSNAKGTLFNIPWTEVASVDGPPSGDLAMMRGDLDPDPAPVTSIIEARDPQEALRLSLWPGVLLHGSGLRYCGDYGSFVGLAGAEVFGVVLGAFGGYLEAYPNTSDTDRQVPAALIGVGAACFLGTWLWDIAFCRGTALRVDAAHGLAL